MSNKLVKNGNGFTPVAPFEEEPLLQLMVTRSGIQLKSPMPPAEVCKMLQSISVDLMFKHFQPAEVSKIHSV